MGVMNNPAGYLASAVSAQGAQNPIDCRAFQNGYLWYQVSGQSAIFNLQVSHDLTAWMNVDTYTATATQTGTAQLIGVLPYVRLSAVKVYTGTGGNNGGTAVLWAYWHPGLQG